MGCVQRRSRALSRVYLKPMACESGELQSFQIWVVYIEGLEPYLSVWNLWFVYNTRNISIPLPEMFLVESVCKIFRVLLFHICTYMVQDAYDCK